MAHELLIYDQCPEFMDIYGLCKDRTLLSPERLFVLYNICKRAAFQDGAIIEVGVYKGGSAMVMCHGINGARPIDLYDTFTGIPDKSGPLDEDEPGKFAADYKDVEQFLRGELVRFHVGLFPDTFVTVPEIAVAHVDCDIAFTAKACLECFWEKLIPGGVIVFDDYAASSCIGLRYVVEAFCNEHQTSPICTKNCQAILIK